MAPITTPNEYRCPNCTAVLVHAGAICVICDDQAHYEAAIRTSPPLRMPGAETDEQDAELDLDLEDEGLVQAV